MNSLGLVLATEGSLPFLDLLGEDLAEYGSGLTDLMTGGDKLSDPLGVTLDMSQEGLVTLTQDLLSVLVQKVHLFIDLGRETGHKRLKHGAQQAECAEAGPDDLTASG
jgi:hypothetical protein